MKYLHTMVRVRDLDASMAFYRDALGLVEVRRSEHPAGRFTLVYLAAPGDEAAQIELTYNWPDENGNVEDYGSARNFGHVAYAVKDIHATCAKLLAAG
ncbi:MAG: VOC family protein, partial [Inhella sp.]